MTKEPFPLPTGNLYPGTYLAFISHYCL